MAVLRTRGRFYGSLSVVPVHPLHKLFVLLSLEHVVVLVEAVHALVVRHQLSNLLGHLVVIQGSTKKITLDTQ